MRSCGEVGDTHNRCSCLVARYRIVATGSGTKVWLASLSIPRQAVFWMLSATSPRPLDFLESCEQAPLELEALLAAAHGLRTPNFERRVAGSRTFMSDWTGGILDDGLSDRNGVDRPYDGSCDICAGRGTRCCHQDRGCSLRKWRAHVRRATGLADGGR